MSSFDYTFDVNTDGCKIGKGAKQTIYPVFARVNELLPSLRQKFVFLIGIFGDKVEPNMESFLSPIVDEINDVAKVGVEWYPNGERDEERHVSHFYIRCFCVDGKACYQMLNMVNYAADYACSSCTFKGVNIKKHNVTQQCPIHWYLPLKTALMLRWCKTCGKHTAIQNKVLCLVLKVYRP